MVVELATLLLGAVAGSGALVGALAAWRKDRALAAIDAAPPPPAPSDGPYRGAPEPEPRAPRALRTHRHDYDRMLGRTLFR